MEFLQLPIPAQGDYSLILVASIASGFGAIIIYLYKQANKYRDDAEARYRADVAEQRAADAAESARREAAEIKQRETILAKFDADYKAREEFRVGFDDRQTKGLERIHADIAAFFRGVESQIQAQNLRISEQQQDVDALKKAVHRRLRTPKV